jgi:hypothetical protein
MTRSLDKKLNILPAARQNKIQFCLWELSFKNRSLDKKLNILPAARQNKIQFCLWELSFKNFAFRNSNYSVIV